MVDCDKRQKETSLDREGEEKVQHRCVDKRVPDTYLKIVELPTCEACPIMQMRKDMPSCERPEWEKHLISVETISRDVNPDQLDVNPAESDLGYETGCPYRWDGVCRITGHEINPEICKACDQETAEAMSELKIFGKGLKWAGAVTKWIRMGRPVRSDERVREIFEKYCQPCELYDSENHGCKKCGCNVSTDTAPLANKLKLATEECPMGLWK